MCSIWRWIMEKGEVPKLTCPLAFFIPLSRLPSQPRKVWHFLFCGKKFFLCIIYLTLWLVVKLQVQYSKFCFSYIYFKGNLSNLENAFLSCLSGCRNLKPGFQDHYVWIVFETSFENQKALCWFFFFSSHCMTPVLPKAETASDSGWWSFISKCKRKKKSTLIYFKIFSHFIYLMKQ